MNFDSYVPAAVRSSAQPAVPTRSPLFFRSQGSGASVVCLYSSTGSHAQWRGLADALSSSCQVITPDLHGHGRSAAWPIGTPSTLDIDADAVMRAVTSSNGGAQGRNLHLVGHSYGGAVAMQIALRHPHRVRSLTLYEPAAFGVLRTFAPRDPALAEIEGIALAVRTLLACGDAEGAAQAFVGYWGGAKAWAAMPAATRDAVLARMPTVPRHFDALFGATWSPALLRSLSVPVLLLHGSETRASAARVVEWLGRTLPCLQRIEIFGAGHLGPMTHEAMVSAAIVRHLRRETTLRSAAPAVEPALA